MACGNCWLCPECERIPEEVDLPLPEDEAIDEAFPTRSRSHDQYAEAARMIGAKRSKGALVALVNWLLVRVKSAEIERQASRAMIRPDVNGLASDAWKARAKYAESRTEDLQKDIDACRAAHNIYVSEVERARANVEQRVRELANAFWQRAKQLDVHYVLSRDLKAIASNLHGVFNDLPKAGERLK